MPRTRSFRVSVAALLALLIGLAATAVLFGGLRRLEHDKVELDFRQRARIRMDTVQQQLEGAVQVLKVLNGLFATIEPVSRKQFHVFTQPLIEQHPYIRAFNFHRYVNEKDRASFEKNLDAIRAGQKMNELRQGKPVRAAMRPRHYVVDYIEPFAGNEIVLGLDVSPNIGLMNAVDRAASTGNPYSSGLLTLAQDGGKLRGFLVVMPVYRHGAALTDAAARRAATIGDTAAVFNARDMIDKTLRVHGLLNDPRIGVRVYADRVADTRYLAFADGDFSPEPETAGLPAWLFHDYATPIEHTFSVAGQPWHIVVTAAPVALTARNNGSLYGLIAGVVGSLLLAAYLQATSMRARRIQNLVNQRTAELREANALLVEDIAARKRVEEALQLRQRAIEASANAVILTSAAAPHYPVEYVNPAFERITGYQSDEVTGRSLSLLWADDLEQPAIKEMQACARERREGHAVLRTYTRNGDLFWSDVYVAPVRDESGEVRNFVVALYDITATKRYQAELEFQANRDTLTGLANRNVLRDRLAQAIAYTHRYGRGLWVLFINLDRFKFVNDTLGHRAGDMLLKKIAGRMQASVRDTDTVARLSADEFVVVLQERERGEEKLSHAVVQRIMDAIAVPAEIEGYEFVVGSSIGIAVSPNDGDDPEMLIKHAGIAMYRAKESGRNNFQFYTPSMNERALERLRIEGDLRCALDRNEFVVHYQPQVSLASGRVIGVEALIRWNHPALGMVSPVRFIDIAEEMGLIVPIGAWVVRTACEQSMQWQREGFGPVRVAVNLSARQFYQQDLVASIADVLLETGLPPHLLELELTESMMMTDAAQSAEILGRLKALGVHLSIDDFGTGYSSLSYLKRFPIDLLKIDQSFVRDITVDPDDAAIVTSIISLAHSLRLEVIAEGVETEAQLAYLRTHGCDCMQGYYFSRPVPHEEVAQILRHNSVRPLNALPQSTAPALSS